MEYFKMSNILSQVTTNKQSSGIRVVIAGVEKIGKTTLACGSSRPLLIPLEIGYAGVNVNKTPFIESYENFILLLDEIIESCKKDKSQRSPDAGGLRRDNVGQGFFGRYSSLFESVTREGRDCGRDNRCREGHDREVPARRCRHRSDRYMRDGRKRH